MPEPSHSGRTLKQRERSSLILITASILRCVCVSVVHVWVRVSLPFLLLFFFPPSLSSCHPPPPPPPLLLPFFSPPPPLLLLLPLLGSYNMQPPKANFPPRFHAHREVYPSGTFSYSRSNTTQNFHVHVPNPQPSSSSFHHSSDLEGRRSPPRQRLGSLPTDTSSPTRTASGGYGRVMLCYHSGKKL